MRKFNLIQLLVLLVLSFSFAYTVVLADEMKGPLYPKITIPESAGKKCVRPEDEMRKVHPDLLKHDRISTMRHGVRNKADGKPLDGSLKACISCHAIKKDDGQYVRITDEKHFCSSCHQYVGVSLDCFQCHRDIPEK